MPPFLTWAMQPYAHALSRYIGALALAAVGLVLTSPASALTCSFTFTNLVFGNVDVTANAAVEITGTLSISCSAGTKRDTIRICPHIGPGTGGAGTNANPRRLLSGSDTLNFNFFSDAARTVIWGSLLHGWTGVNPPTIDLLLNNSGAGSTTATVYGRVLSGQQTAVTGSYSSTFSGADVRIRYASSSTGTCATIGATNEGTASFTASATVVPSCTVSATALNFGTRGLLQSAIDVSNTLSLSCTNGQPYTLGLNGGSTNATDPTQRKMSQGAQSVTYGLYRDTGRTLPWGNSSGVNTSSGTGTGSTQNFTVYGRVPVQTTPSAGTYTDTVVVTVTY